MFVALGDDARGVLEIIVFFPQGVDEEELEWVFPAIVRIQEIAETFCILSLTHRTGSFVTMFAPLRDHLPTTKQPLFNSTPPRLQGPVLRPSGSHGVCT